MGRALDKLGRFDEAVKAYRDAAQIKPNDDQAWLGLRGLYESKPGLEHVDDYIGIGLQLAEIYLQAYVLALLIIKATRSRLGAARLDCGWS